MSTNSTWDRVEQIKRELGLKTDTEFYKLAGVDKGMGAQWKSGQVQTIGADYAFRLQDKTGFQARWIMFGAGEERICREHRTIIAALPLLDKAIIDTWLLVAEDKLAKLADQRKVG